MDEISEDSDKKVYNLRKRKDPRKVPRRSNKKRCYRGSKNLKNPKLPKLINPNRRMGKYMTITKDGYLLDDFIEDGDEEEVFQKDDNFSLADRTNLEPTDEYDPGQPAEYFDLDSTHIQKDIVKEIVKNNPNVSRGQIEEAVKNGFNGLGKYFIKDYLSCKPSEDYWKLGISDKEIKSIEKITI